MEGLTVSPLEIICFGSSVAFSGLFYYLYRKKIKAVKKIQDTPKFQVDEQLTHILEATTGKCLHYVALEGLVQPVGKPLRSQHHEHLNGVIQKQVLKEHRLIWNSLARNWTESERVIHESVNMVPFVISPPDGKTGPPVRVQDPLEASGLHLETVYEHFEMSSQGITDLIGSYLSGEKPKGLLETEEMLQVGATLTGIGQLVLDSQGVLRLQPPEDGSEYFLRLGDWRTLLKEQQSVAWFWKGTAIFCSMLGAVVVFIVVRRMYRHMREKQALAERRREFEAMRQPSGAGPSNLAHGQDDVEDVPENSCVVCLLRPRECVLLVCGHVCCCFQCFEALPTPVCPICRGHIERVVPLYQA
ncbi:mitochondrial ubiquitin ligase activator of nfkb 1-A-like [Ambystoma mexicanum]|uniref:mitochondrial ubiquitin ligase activator of nfkb 1-A-like n=1 Tax=Ambystoma mexicanum TaxID=8296 RepID=UPI0037E91AD6